MSTHQAHHYSITVQTLDLAVLNCLRSLSAYAQETGNSRIVWGGTGKEKWNANGNHVTFNFSNPAYRSKFKQEAFRVLPYGSWEVIEEQDDDPAQPQS
jgi:hypothetical protein